MKQSQHSILLLALILGAGSTATAAAILDPPSERDPLVTQAASFEAVRGKIRQVNDESFVLMVGEEALTIPLSESTKYFLDDKEVRRNQVLKVGQEVRVETADGVALSVTARSSS